jgi:hypothetical protein
MGKKKEKSITSKSRIIQPLKEKLTTAVNKLLSDNQLSLTSKIEKG